MTKVIDWQGAFYKLARARARNRYVLLDPDGRIIDTDTVDEGDTVLYDADEDARVTDAANRR